MYLVVTRTFPPEVGGMQNLMWGLARSLAKIDLIKVFADYSENHEDFEKNGGEYVKLIPSLNDNDDWVRNFAEYLAEKEEEFVTK